MVRTFGTRIMNSRMELRTSQARQPGDGIVVQREVTNICRNEGPEFSAIFNEPEVKEAGVFVLKVAILVYMPKF